MNVDGFDSETVSEIRRLFPEEFTGSNESVSYSMSSSIEETVKVANVNESNSITNENTIYVRDNTVDKFTEDIDYEEVHDDTNNTTQVATSIVRQLLNGDYSNMSSLVGTGELLHVFSNDSVVDINNITEQYKYEEPLPEEEAEAIFQEPEPIHQEMYSQEDTSDQPMDLSEANQTQDKEELPIHNGELLVNDSLGTTEPVIYDNYSRFKGADWFKIVQKQDIILAGLGGIGSYVNFFLSRLGPNSIILYDDDLFDSTNMSGQLVSVNNIGHSKVLTAIGIAMGYSNYIPTGYNAKYDTTSAVDKIMICGFDNMKARNCFYYKWKLQFNGIDELEDSSKKEYLFIDGRLLAEEYEIHCITGDNSYAQQVYENKYLFTDSAVAEVDCTLKQTSHFAGEIACQMVKYFTMFCNNLSQDNPERRMPYYTYHNGLMNTYKFEY